MSSRHTVEKTPVIQNPKKRELTSSEFDIEQKKNKTASEAAVAEPDPAVMATETTEAMDAHSISPMAPHIMIPPSEILKITEMLQDTFRGHFENTPIQICRKFYLQKPKLFR